MILVALILSFLPALAYSYIIFWIDRFEKEPSHLLYGAFIWGAIVAAGASFVLNSAAGIWTYQLTQSLAIAELARGTFSAPIVEESFKAFAVLIIFVVRRDELDSVLDGIAYAGIAAMGFAATENVIYLYSRGYVPNGLEGMGIQFVLRVVFGAWNHSFYTAFTGIGLAEARLTKKKWLKFLFPIVGWLVAILVHTLHNSLHASVAQFGTLVRVILADWVGWLAMGLLILWALNRERKWIVQEIAEEVENGVVTAEQYHLLTEHWLSNEAKILTPLHRKETDETKLFRMCAELAYKKHQRKMVGEKHSNTTEMIEQLRLEVGKLSQAFSATIA